jgi:hypothetical protein
MRITTLRTTSECPDITNCVSIHDLDIHPERRYVITKRETDPAVLDAFAHLIGDDEQLGYGPTAMFPTQLCTCGGAR